MTIAAAARLGVKEIAALAGSGVVGRITYPYRKLRLCGLLDFVVRVGVRK